MGVLTRRLDRAWLLHTRCNAGRPGLRISSGTGTTGRDVRGSSTAVVGDPADVVSGDLQHCRCECVDGFVQDDAYFWQLRSDHPMSARDRLTQPPKISFSQG